MSTNANVGKIIQSSAWFTKYAPQSFEEIVVPDVTKYNQIKEVIDNGFISGNIFKCHTCFRGSGGRAHG